MMLSFLDEERVRHGGLQNLDVFFIGGGDTFAIAEALDEQGANELRRFLESGGVYMGACAGAYLLLALSGPPFDPFAGFTEVRMTNVSLDLPPCMCMPTKFSSPYSGMYVVHPVRESVLMKTNQSELFHHGDMLIAPLYGGPAMVPSDQETAFAWYYGFTEDTLFLGKKELAEELLFAKAAVVRKECGQGAIWLFGPHCEHPAYPGANEIMLAAMYAGLGKRQSSQKERLQRDEEYADCTMERELLKDIKKHVSNARIMALGMESTQLHWYIGRKSYEPEKIRVFLEAVWTRLLTIMKQRRIYCEPAESSALRDQMQSICAELKALHQGIQDGAETTARAALLFKRLKKVSAAFLTIYFRNRLVQLVG